MRQMWINIRQLHVTLLQLQIIMGFGPDIFRLDRPLESPK
jgi:hypothetical protein